METQTNEIRSGKGVRRIILLERDVSGCMVAQTLWKSKSKKKRKKRSSGLRDIERAVRSAGKAQQKFNDTLMKEHRRSNRKRKDGWLRDIGPNIYKASKKSWGKLSKDVKLR